jgi:hypothetical protein
MNTEDRSLSRTAPNEDSSGSIVKKIGSILLADSTRAEFANSVTAEDLRQLAGHPQIKVLQCATPKDDAVWVLLNDCFFAERPDVELRVYGHYSTECDLSFARKMGNVHRFAADDLMRARNVKAIAEIRHLESLSLGIFELDDFRVLESIPSTVTSLRLSATRSRRLSLAPLSRFRSLKVLYLEAQSEGIDVLRELQALEELTLRSITTRDLSYLAPLRDLWYLDIKLGGIRSFTGIEGKKRIKYLELWQVRGLQSVDVVAALPGLQNVFLQSLPHVESMPALKDSTALRRVVVQNLKGIRDFSALEGAPALEEFGLVEGNRQTPEQLLPVLRNPAVRRVAALFGSNRKNRAFSRLREAHGKVEWEPWEPFEYR